MIRTESLSEQIERELREEILLGHFAPEQRRHLKNVYDRTLENWDGSQNERPCQSSSA